MEFSTRDIHATIDPRNLEYGVLQRADALVLRMIQDSWPERPIYFARSAVGYPRTLGLENYVLTQGLASKLFVPPANGARQGHAARSGRRLARRRAHAGAVERRLHRTKSVIKEGQWVDRPSVSMPALYVFVGAELADALRATGRAGGGEQSVRHDETGCGGDESRRFDSRARTTDYCAATHRRLRRRDAASRREQSTARAEHGAAREEAAQVNSSCYLLLSLGMSVAGQCRPTRDRGASRSPGRRGYRKYHHCAVRSWRRVPRSSTFAPHSDVSSSIVAARNVLSARSSELAKIVDSGRRARGDRAGDDVSKVEIVEPIVEREVVALGAAGDGVPVGDDAARVPCSERRPTRRARRNTDRRDRDLPIFWSVIRISAASVFSPAWRRKYASPSLGLKNVRIVPSALNAMNAPLARSNLDVVPSGRRSSSMLPPAGASRSVCAARRYSCWVTRPNSAPCFAKCSSNWVRERKPTLGRVMASRATLAAGSTVRERRR